MSDGEIRDAQRQVEKRWQPKMLLPWQSNAWRRSRRSAEQRNGFQAGIVGQSQVSGYKSVVYDEIRRNGYLAGWAFEFENKTLVR